jgi:chromosome partitioning protein
MRIYACANLKGGVGKTTTAVHLAAALARLNRRVLAIDIDQQADFTTWVGPEEEATLTIVDVMRRPADGALLRRAITKSRISGVDLIPGSPSMIEVEAELGRTPAPSTALARALRHIDDYDDVIIDCPPGMGFIVWNALAVATDVITPIDGILALAKITSVQETLTELERAGVITKAPTLRTLQTKIDARVALAREISALLKEFAGTTPLRTGIRLNARMAEAPGQQQTLFDYAPGATAVADYAALAEELVS